MSTETPSCGETLAQLFYDRQKRQLGPLIRGHVLWYEPRAAPAYAAAAGLRLLGIVVLLELVIGPRMSILSWAALGLPPTWLRTSILLAIALVGVRFAAGIRLHDVGFIPPRHWRLSEWLYLAQIVALAIVVFLMLFGRRLGLFEGSLSVSVSVMAAAATQLLWGFYQEVIYRGILQTELMRRFGTIAGALVANLAFTFGPLHFYHLRDIDSPLSTVVMMTAIFFIGLIFSIVFARARNVAVVGILHGVGNVFGNVGVT